MKSATSLQRRLVTLACAALTMASVMPVARAADYPSKPVTVVVPFAVGGSSDLTARRVSVALSKLMNQSVIIQNQPSAGGFVGVNAVKRAPKDGYTLLAGTVSTHAINSALYKNLSYDVLKDFTPITRIGSFPNILVARRDLGVKSLAELVELAKKRAAGGTPLTYASGGVGSTSHLGGELLKQVANVEMTHVPYKGAAGALNDLLGGRIDFIFGNTQFVLPHINSGALVPLAVSSRERTPLLPDVPSVVEVGFEQAEMSVWIGLFAPAGIPADVAQRLSKLTLEALSSPEVVEPFKAEGVSIDKDDSPEAFRQEIAKQIEIWRGVIDKAGIAMEGGG